MATLSLATRRGPLSNLDVLAKWQELLDHYTKNVEMLADYQIAAEEFILQQTSETLGLARLSGAKVNENIIEIGKAHAILWSVMRNQYETIEYSSHYVEKQIDRLLDQTNSPILAVKPEHRDRLERYIWTRMPQVGNPPIFPFENVRQLERLLSKLNIALPEWFFREYRSLLPSNVIPNLDSSESNELAGAPNTPDQAFQFKSASSKVTPSERPRKTKKELVQSFSLCTEGDEKSE